MIICYFNQSLMVKFCILLEDDGDIGAMWRQNISFLLAAKCWMKFSVYVDLNVVRLTMSGRYFKFSLIVVLFNSNDYTIQFYLVICIKVIQLLVTSFHIFIRFFKKFTFQLNNVHVLIISIKIMVMLSISNQII